jgi:hypothetical protein
MSDFQEQIDFSVSDADFDSALGSDNSDVPTATDEPASSSEPVERPEADQTATETPEETKPDEPQADAETPSEETPEPEVETSQETSEDRLNWDSAPEDFRKTYKSVKDELAEVRKNSLQEKFFDEPESFLGELEGLSSSQYQQIAQHLFKRGVETMPNEVAEYMAHVAPDAVASKLAQVDPSLLTRALGIDLPPDQVRKIVHQVVSQDLVQYLNDNDDGTTPDTPTPAPAQATPKADTSKFVSIDEVEKLVEQRVAQADKPKQIEALKQETFLEVMAPVHELIDEMGLRPKPDDPPEERDYKEMIIDLTLRSTFDHLFEDEKNAPKARKMLEFIDSLDKSGVKHLASTAKVIARDFAGRRLEILTAQRAKAKTKPTQTKKDPPKVIPSSASVSSFGNPVPSAATFEITDADMERAGAG